MMRSAGVLLLSLFRATGGLGIERQRTGVIIVYSGERADWSHDASSEGYKSAPITSLL